MDGYAVRSADLKGASPSRPVTLSIAGESSAGNPFTRPIKKGGAVRIMTGGKLPGGADAVVPLEMAAKEGNLTVTVTAQARPGDYVRRPGEDIPRGHRVVAEGDLLSPSHLAMIASAGHANVRVTVRPRVGILATGDELVRPDRTPGASCRRLPD